MRVFPPSQHPHLWTATLATLALQLAFAVGLYYAVSILAWASRFLGYGPWSFFPVTG